LYTYECTAAPLIARLKSEEGEAFMASQVVWLQVWKTDPEILFYKTPFDAERDSQVQNLKNKYKALDIIS
jgi:hypothetical protein